MVKEKLNPGVMPGMWLWKRTKRSLKSVRKPGRLVLHRQHQFGEYVSIIRVYERGQESESRRRT